MDSEEAKKEFLSKKFAEFFKNFDEFCKKNGEVVIKEYRDCIQLDIPTPKKSSKPD